MDMDMKTIVKSTSMAINVMDTSMSTKTINMSTKIISMSTKTTSMSISMNINMEIIVKDTNTKIKSTIIHPKNIHTITNMIMKTAMEGMIINTLPNQMKKMSIKKKNRAASLPGSPNFYLDRCQCTLGGGGEKAATR
jgi:hypothetical protein